MSRTAIVNELFQEYAARHGGRPIRDGGVYLFPDGATCDAQDKYRNEPDESEQHRLPLQLRYWSLRSEMIRRDFDRWLGALQGRFGPVNSRDLLTPELPRDLPDEVSVLEFLAACLKEARSELNRVNEIINPPPSPEEVELARRQQAEAEEFAREEEEQRQRERADRIAQIVASVEEESDVTPPADPKMKLLPGKAVTLSPDPYDLSINQPPE